MLQIALHELFNNFYWKLLMVIVLAIAATFAHEINLFKDGVITYIILGLVILLLISREDYGLVILLCAIFILSYNNVTHKKAQITEGFSRPRKRRQGRKSSKRR